MTTSPLKPIILDLLQHDHRDEQAIVQEIGESERNAAGTWECWSFKDHLAHRTFWHRDLVTKAHAILRGEQPPAGDADEEQINTSNFEQQQGRPFAELHADSERVYGELIALAEQLSEDDLTTSKRFDAITGGHPLYTAFAGACYEHDQEHLAQYFLDHNDVARATRIRDHCAGRIVDAALPEWVKGWFSYNLACFYAQQGQLAQARAALQRAIAFDPKLEERWVSDSDLGALRAEQS